MDLQGLSFNRQAGDIKLKPDAALKLQAGDIVRGLIQAIGKDGLVQLLVRGKSVLAEAQIPLQAGQELYLQADRMENGRLYLRVVDPQAQAELPDLALRGMLTKLGLKSDELTSNIARKLIAYNLPVSKENIEAVVKMTNLLPNQDSRVLEAATFILSRGNRISNPERLASLVEFFSTPQAREQLSQAINQLTLTDGEELVNQGQSGEKVVPGSKPLGNGVFLPAEGMPITRDNTTPTLTRAEVTVVNPQGSSPTISNDLNANQVNDKNSLVANPASIIEPKVAIPETLSLISKGENSEVRPALITDNNKSNPNSGQVSDKVLVAKTGDEVITSPATRVASWVESITNGQPKTNPASVVPKTYDGGELAANKESVVSPSYNSGVSTTPAEVRIANPNGTKLPLYPEPDNEPWGTKTLLVNSSQQNSQSTAKAEIKLTVTNNNGEVDSANDPMKTTTRPTETASSPVGEMLNRGTNKTVSEPTSANQPVPNQNQSSDQALTRPVNNPTNLPSNGSAEAITALTRQPDATLEVVARKLGELIKPALEALVTNLDQGKPDANQLKQVLKDQQALLPDIKYARQVLDNLNNGNSHPMRVALERLEQEWGGQALYNRLEGNALRDQSNFYMTLPLRWQGRLENAEVSISWRRDNRSKGAIPNNLTVNVGLNTVNLGAVIFHLRTQGKQLGLSIYLENEVVKSQVDQQIPELITQLTNMGYDTSFMGSQVVKQPNLRPEFIDEVSNDNLPPVTGLDLKI